MRTSRTLSTTTALAALALGGLLSGSPAATADGGVPARVAPTELRPAQLERGTEARIPHLDGRTIVDGAIRVRVHAREIRLIGRSGSDYVVSAASHREDQRRALRVTPDGDQTVLFSSRLSDLLLSDDGSRIATTSFLRQHRSQVRVYDAVTGHRQASRTFRSSNVSLLDFGETRLVLSDWDGARTFWWDATTDTTRKITDRLGGTADIRANRLASYTRDPFQGGCTVVSTLRTPSKRLWSSCDQRVDAFSASGERMATIDILSDGPGPGDAWLRKTGGRVLAHYRARSIGQLAFESDRALLIGAVGSEYSALVRCLVADCERASDLEPAPQP